LREKWTSSSQRPQSVLGPSCLVVGSPEGALCPESFEKESDPYWSHLGEEVEHKALPVELKKNQTRLEAAIGLGCFSYPCPLNPASSWVRMVLYVLWS
jgi:hypothetical protein